MENSLPFPSRTRMVLTVGSFMASTKVLSAFLYLKERLSEPSTHASLAVIFASVGIRIDDVLIQSVFAILTIIFGFAGILLKEDKRDRNT